MLTILNLPQQLTGDSVSVWVIFPVWSCRLLRDYSNMTVCTTPLEVSVSHTHTHMTPTAAVCCGSWSAASVNWLSVEEKEEEKEEGGRSRRPWAAEEVKTYWKSVHREHFCPTWAKQHAQTAATALFSQPCFMLRGNVHTVSRQTLLTSHWFHQLGCSRWRPDLLGNVKNCIHKEIQCDLR